MAADANARLSAVGSIREALVRFADERSETLAAVRSAIERANSLVDEAISRSEYEYERCNEQLLACHRAAFAADPYGSASCGAEQQALDDAVDTLSQLRHARRELESAVAVYDVAEHRCHRSIDTDLPNAVHYLESVVAGYDAFLMPASPPAASPASTRPASASEPGGLRFEPPMEGGEAQRRDVGHTGSERRS